MTPASDNNTEDRPMSSDEGFGSIETPEELRPRAGQAGPTQADPRLLPMLDRERPERARLIPKWVPLAAVGAIAFIAVVVTVALLVGSARTVTVPNVVGVTRGIARTRLAEAGLEVRVTEERFSAQPIGEVLEQQPPAGTELHKGDVVTLVVSAGIEEFPMPDVVGNGVELATGTLTGRGLVVEIEKVTSDVQSDTVLASIPAAGAPVRSGDVVRLQVASPRPISEGLRPFQLGGVTVLIDPAPASEGRADVTLEVGRRLRALFEASGATVTMLRSGNDTVTSDVDRSARAAQATSTVAIGLSAADSGPGGRQVSASAAESGVVLGTKLVSHLTTSAPPASVRPAATDPVLSASQPVWARVWLGSYLERADTNAFADPNWADAVARAIYTAVGEVFGAEEGL